MRAKSKILVLVGMHLVVAAGCQRPLPCSDCEEDEQGSEVDLPADTPDLPCGGADLSSDPDNCGACGTQCPIYPYGVGTEWEVGGCVDGACAPRWGVCAPHDESLPRTCSELCSSSERICVAGGCAGHTAALFEVNPFDPVCWTEFTEPYAAFDGGCDELITAPPVEPGVGVAVQCCCEVPPG